MHGSGRVLLRAAARANGAARRSVTSLSSSSGVLVVRSSKSGVSTLRGACVSSVRAQRLGAVSSVQLRAFSASAEATDVPVPSMGDSISEGTVVEWLKQPGDAVAEDEVVVVLETDKVSVDVRAPFAGAMGQQLAAIDDNVLVGASLFQIVKGAEAAPAAATEAPAAAAAAAAPSGEETTVPVPSMGDSISEGTVVEWLKKAGDFAAEDEVVVVLETDKVSVDVRAPKAGTVTSILADVDQTVEIGVPLFKIVLGGEAPAAAAPAASTPAPAAPVSTPAPAAAAPTPAAAPVAQPDVAGANPLLATPERASRREKMSRMRLRTAERLKESQNTAASLTTFQEVDMSKLMGLRKQYKDAFEAKHGVKLGFMSAFVKASASALLEVPGVNAMIDDEHQEIVYRDYVDMSVAVSTPKGLVTPVLKNTESMSFADVEKGLAELAARARDGKLTLEEMTGGNFTISNGGVFGSLMGTPIINLPQSGILGMHGTKMRPVVVDGEVVARPMMYLALTYDHRLIDGREGVTCLKAIADKIENPERLLLDI
ncbi:Dihydrolipoyllysine-residue succinyltransferase component of 2-oxoglutarate dehydrogenase complex [Phytophthora fragariae]|uniref:dihydrolipoyllysine-residue succinyltransferase n=4 Tax=Phytophthora fragariae TaxID=53985 RepID=A0A6A3VUZ3_9STRA|nr:Dihydrolipoyllysine-residue succinyltransferase component of 2-oxoglutarate dehydrogenase complex [Phytophthora fragariae]KAE8920609.1 Dihydrolipoyllysine-residue succinyltransferase component of 2-oxoglutarate dehydrogenase complex [Phytophthora fragariae]KAE8967276.1 Dihydrolipoyllysine-residue succinyltransferase component of 2-oxoglutarate dehydrogenase complex [Phytophthora fragariae]KAE9065458.1 Dihydrolipoyllysine-residue succinyltransferase component of 2-oxoglutarate dehydrogenase co